MTNTDTAHDDVVEAIENVADYQNRMIGFPVHLWDELKTFLTKAQPSDDVRERKPVAWRYEYSVQYRNRMECTKNLAPLSVLSEHRWSPEEARNYSETPLYTALAPTTQPRELPDHAKRYLAYMCAYFHAYVNQGGVSLQSEAANDSISEIMELVPQEFHDLDFHLPSFGGEEGPWKCFHCNALFEDREAAFHHFGESEDEIAACLIEKGLATTTQPEMLMSQEWLDKKIAADPDDAECEAGPDTQGTDSGLAGELEEMVSRFRNKDLGKGGRRGELYPQGLGWWLDENADRILAALRNQPSVDDVIELCAKVADEQQVLLTVGATSKMHARECREQIARAIRARKGGGA